MLFNVYFWERERVREQVSMSGGEAEREEDTESEAGSALSCQHRAWCEARTHKLRDHDLGWSQMLNQLSHLGTPGHNDFFK